MAAYTALRYADLEEDERDFWEKILTRQGLGVNVGSSPSQLVYGCRYFDSSKPFDYSLSWKPARKKR
jgi:hypothetical protein